MATNSFPHHRTGEVLKQPRSVRSVNGLLETTMIYEKAKVQIDDSTITYRAMNGTTPGPSLRIKAGDQLIVHLQNRLKKQPNTRPVNNAFSAPDEGNIHYHGMHFSGDLPSDDVRVPVPAGENRTYISRLLPDHMPGTHWYHPHRHGATSLSVWGGAYGSLIVEDEPGTLPPEVEAAPEQILGFLWWNATLLEKVIAKPANDTMFNVQGPNPNMTINGQKNPVVEVEKGAWNRFRVYWLGRGTDILDLGGTEPLYLQFPGCEVNLLAKDGIYIRDYPRAVVNVPQPPGGRSDLMVRCNGKVGTDSNILTMTEEAVVGKVRIVPRKDSTPAAAFGPAEPFPGFPSFPRYLKDIRKVAPTPGCSCITQVGPDVPQGINGRMYNIDEVLHTTFQGAVAERVFDANRHPYHQHVHPFQLIDGQFGWPNLTSLTIKHTGGVVPDPIVNEIYNQPGDWHDVQQGTGIIRFNTEDIDGTMMLHCHDVRHEDLGMMSYESVVRGADFCTCRNPANGESIRQKVMGVLRVEEVKREMAARSDSNNGDVALSVPELAVSAATFVAAGGLIGALLTKAFGKSRKYESVDTAEQ